MTVMTQVIARLIFPASLAIAAAILVKGYVDTGDGFSAGVIAATGVVLQYMAFGYENVRQTMPIRWAPFGMVFGLLLSLGVAFVPAILGEEIFSHAPPPGGELIHLGSLEVHSAVLFDVGVFLIVFGFIVQATSMIAQIVERRAL